MATDQPTPGTVGLKACVRSLRSAIVALGLGLASAGIEETQRVLAAQVSEVEAALFVGQLLQERLEATQEALTALRSQPAKAAGIVASAEQQLRDANYLLQDLQRSIETNAVVEAQLQAEIAEDQSTQASQPQWMQHDWYRDEPTGGRCGARGHAQRVTLDDLTGNPPRPC